MSKRAVILRHIHKVKYENVRNKNIILMWLWLPDDFRIQQLEEHLATGKEPFMYVLLFS